MTAANMVDHQTVDLKKKEKKGRRVPLSLAAILTCFSTASYGKHNPTRPVLSILHRCTIYALWPLRCDFHHDSNFTLMGYFKDLATNTLRSFFT